MRGARWLVAIGLTLGCGGDSGGESASGDFGTSGLTTGSATSAPSGSTSMGESGDPKFDVGVASGTAADDGTGGDGCKKVDFVFAIDNSGSMHDEQDRLIGAFPGFIASIVDTVQGQDHHIMVVDSDTNPTWVCEEFQGGGHCNGGLQQPNCAGYTCGDVDMLQSCDVELGGGVVRPYGGNASNMPCDFPPDRRFLIETDPDLAGKFGCAALVGTSGNSHELPVTSMVTALSDPMAQPGACNEGFLRDDAILVLTIVSDDPPLGGENDDATSGDASAWYDAVVAAKGGNADAVVVIGLVPYGDVTCVVTEQETQSFIDFVQMFGQNGVLGSVCDQGYADVFDAAVSIIDTTCDDFMPEG